jgi:hypothetical protein
MSATARAMLAEVIADAEALADLAVGIAPLLPVAQAERPPLYTVARLATLTGLSRRKIGNDIRRGELAAVKRGGYWIVPADAAAAYATPVVSAAPSSRRGRGRPESGASTVRNALGEAMGLRRVD